MIDRRTVVVDVGEVKVVVVVDGAALRLRFKYGEVGELGSAVGGTVVIVSVVVCVVTGESGATGITCDCIVLFDGLSTGSRSNELLEAS